MSKTSPIYLPIFRSSSGDRASAPQSPLSRMAVLALVAALTSAGGVLSGAAPAQAQGAEGFTPGAASREARFIRVTGEANMQVSPTEAVITLGVRAEAKTAAAAMAEVSEKMTQVLQSLSDNGVEDRDIQTRNISVNTLWSNRNSDNRREVTGFAAANTVELRVRALGDLGRILDQVLQEGANEMQGLRFQHGDLDGLRDQLRYKAVEDGMRKARQLAEASGMALGPVREIRDGAALDHGPRPMARFAMESMGADVPVAAGEMTVAHQVSMVFDMRVLQTQP